MEGYVFACVGTGTGDENIKILEGQDKCQKVGGGGMHSTERPASYFCICYYTISDIIYHNYIQPSLCNSTQYIVTKTFLKS